MPVNAAPAIELPTVMPCESRRLGMEVGSSRLTLAGVKTGAGIRR
jgi:hypothetical protein